MKLLSIACFIKPETNIEIDQINAFQAKTFFFHSIESPNNNLISMIKSMIWILVSESQQELRFFVIFIDKDWLHPFIFVHLIDVRTHRFQINKIQFNPVKHHTKNHFVSHFHETLIDLFTLTLLWEWIFVDWLIAIQNLHFKLQFCDRKWAQIFDFLHLQIFSLSLALQTTLI